MLKIAICDDEKRYAEDLEWCLKVWAANTGNNTFIRKFDGGAPLLECLNVTGVFDVIFLDVEMEKMSGLETAAEIRRKDFITAIIFISQYEKYYKEAYDVHPFHFLSKPVNPKKLEETMDAFMRMKGQDIETFTFNINKTRHSLQLNDIVYFYSECRHVTAVCRDQKYSFYGKLNDVQAKLEEKNNRFLRIHQSYLVNMKYVREFHYREVVLFNGQSLYISKENRKKMREIHMMLLE